MGMSGLAAVAEEIAAAGCALLLLVVSPAIVGNRIANHGSPEQQEAWLTGIASGDLRVAFAITEAEAGSNAHNLRTAARREGDRYMLRGEETAILGRRGCSRGPCRRP